MQNGRDSFKRRETNGGDNRSGGRQTVAVALPHRLRLLPSVTCRLSFWFACLLAIIGTTWRPPWASVGLIVVFLVFLVAFEWASRRLTATKRTVNKSLPFSLTKSEAIQQQMVRTKTAEGLDRLEGTFWAVFPANAMTTTVHIPFCPAFAIIPKVQVFSMDATDANLRVVSSKAFGVRVDVKRNNGDIDRLCFAVVAEG